MRFPEIESRVADGSWNEEGPRVFLLNVVRVTVLDNELYGWTRAAGTQPIST